MKHCKHCEVCIWARQEEEGFFPNHLCLMVPLDKASENYVTSPNVARFCADITWEEFKDLYCSGLLDEIDDKYDTILSLTYEESYIDYDLDWLAKRARELGLEKLERAAGLAIEKDAGVYIQV